MSQLPPPPAAPGPEPPPPARWKGRLEVVLVALAVVGGLAVSAVAFATEPEGGGGVEPAAVGSAPDDVVEPATGATGLTGVSGATWSPVDEPAGEQPVTMFFSEWRFVPSGPGSCAGTLSIEWGVESAGVLPIGDRVVIEVTGPGISRTYREPLTEGGVAILVDVPSRNTGRVVAVPESVGGRDVDGFVRVVAEDFC